jgi:GAF domain-containing protein
MLVLRGAPPEEVFAAFTAVAGRLLCADPTALTRYHPDNAVITVACRSAIGDDKGGGCRVPLDGRKMPTQVFETRRPTRVDDDSSAWGLVADVVGKLGIRSGVGVPITVEGRLWGVMTIASTRDRAGEQTAWQHLQLRCRHRNRRPGIKPWSERYPWLLPGCLP